MKITPTKLTLILGTITGLTVVLITSLSGWSEQAVLFMSSVSLTLISAITIKHAARGGTVLGPNIQFYAVVVLVLAISINMRSLLPLFIVIAVMVSFVPFSLVQINKISKQ